jgi:hypothetical protein
MHNGTSEPIYGKYVLKEMGVLRVDQKVAEPVD